MALAPLRLGMSLADIHRLATNGEIECDPSEAGAMVGAGRIAHAVNVYLRGEPVVCVLSSREVLERVRIYSPAITVAGVHVGDSWGTVVERHPNAMVDREPGYARRVQVAPGIDVCFVDRLGAIASTSGPVGSRSVEHADSDTLRVLWIDVR